MSSAWNYQATSDGAPMKGSKSNTTNVRYEKAENAIFSTSLKPSWVPHAMVMEGMFLININKHYTMECPPEHG